MRILFLCALLGCASAQYGKAGVKGGYGGRGFQQNAGESLVRIFGNSTQQGYNTSLNQTVQRYNEVGVCYIQVPTASLVQDPSHIPVGNGSRPDLSEVRRCCSGYIRNIHNPMVCDPVCTKDCVNALCTAPETCTCFPEHVRNIAGFCIPTCPIGCQNGHCAGGECICNDGYSLDSESRFCLPICRENCGGLGNCTAPNTCDCRSGYQPTEGSCKPVCQRCTNGDCIGPNNCLCYPGYAKDNRGECVSQCQQGCGPSGKCVGPNLCNYSPNAAIPQPPLNQSPIHPGSSNHGIPYDGSNPISNSTSSLNRPQYPYSLNSNYPSNPHQPQHPNTQYPNNQQVSYVVPSSNQSPIRPVSDNQLDRHPVLQSNPLNQTTNPQNQPNYPNNQPANQNPTNYLQHQGDNPHYSLSGERYNVSDQANVHNLHSHHPKNPNEPTSSHRYPTNPQISVNSHHQLQNEYHYPTNPSQYPRYVPNYSSNQPPYVQPQYPNQSQSPNQSQYPNQPQNPNPSQYPYQPQGPNQSQNPNHSQYPNQPQYPHQPQYPNQPQHPNPSQYPSNQSMYPSNIPGYPYPNQGSNQQYNYDQSNLEVPVCSQPCINGICVLGNRCTCNTGYVVDTTDPTGSRCKPFCPGGCPNGVCSGPNFCICNMGYYKETGVKGRAMCIKRIRRSADLSIGSKKPKSVAELLVFEIPTDY